MEIDISKYGSYFHDGRILEMEHGIKSIVFALEGAELDPDDIVDDLPLSTDDRLRGRLHLDHVSKILLGDSE
ncbi:MAG: hypothetical protein SP4CHLAM5_11430 [Chlamydiia bacterium]|nr:hypothetical protein [Chlamydiia bacterium]MCH9618999.1 hypothetical protein [Chlamydiia bacterium]